MAYTTIDDPSAHFQTTLYTGNNDVQVVTNGGNSNLQPDWVWLKQRTNARWHRLLDSTRGASKNLYANVNDAEGTETSLTAFGSDGFTLAADGSSDGWNEDGDAHVAWQWKANGGTTSTNTTGLNIDTTVQANTTAGFSIMTYTGTGTDNDSLGHGLGAVPHWVIVKNRDEANGWQMYHHKNTSAPQTDYLNLDDNGATADDSDRWSDQGPSSTIITLGGNDGVSKANVKYVCYAFTEIQGYSKFGKYTGNGNASGPFLYLGFKPAWLMIKRTSNAENWFMVDNTRETANPRGAKFFYANEANAEVTSDKYIDFLSNGFKCRDVTGFHNDNNETYIYMAFAEQPFTSSQGVPANAE